MKRPFKFRSSPNDRVVDNTDVFRLRWLANERYNSPRQRRLRCQQAATLAQYHEYVASILGGILILALIIVLSFL